MFYFKIYKSVKDFETTDGRQHEWTEKPVAMLTPKKFGFLLLIFFCASFTMGLTINKVPVKTVTSSLSIVDQGPIRTMNEPQPSEAKFVTVEKIEIPVEEVRNCSKPERESKIKKSKAYIRRFHETAMSEQLNYRIPYAISMAQGLLESGEGDSRLAKKNNNHFGIKCFSKKCGPGHCSNFTDDSHKDFFRNYKTAWESWRAHSEFLWKKRYKHLHELKINDLEGWAHGLKKAGYATDKNYAEKLLKKICQYRLDQIQSGYDLEETLNKY